MRSSGSGRRQRTPSVSSVSPGGSGVGIPAWIPAEEEEEEEEEGVVVGGGRGAMGFRPVLPLDCNMGAEFGILLN